ncbi:AAA family ATPase [Bradyrhizobium sp. AUGA SZCCT0222]|uniref:AAA family ATPase n=1 Tax=Bradyrhizobium sp. AUGA SZCCT0222 TaxID=2807668 RepID=UPI001BA82270|nr:AAA family ATPase [Bradyrhizobium sp. AUGA SZCCT0222]MBR1267667.1 AAA family ATPase [Bradyrhizobium sp. AUGA SZCCT0222]
MSPSRQTIVIGSHAVDLSREALIDSGGFIVPLRPRAWLVLRFLALHAGRLVGKSELMDEVWTDCEVTEDSLVQAIGDIRRALGEAGRTTLRTLPRRGYMLVPDESKPGTPPREGLASIGDRLSARASRRFVGRQSELALLREAISPNEPGMPLFLLYGPGGIGKTTLLEQLRAEAALNGTVFVRIDATGVSPEPNAMLATLSTALGLNEPAGAIEELVAGFSKHRSVLIVDSFEHLEPMSGWVRDTLLPALPSQVTVVLAGRRVPDTRWTAHPLWCDAMHCIGLDSLSQPEASRLLDAHGVAAGAHSGVLDLCHGHPLALVLVADEVRRLGRVPTELGPDLVRALTKRCVAQAPTALHRAALEACARARTTTVSLLSEVVDASSAVMLFEWLLEQSYVSAVPEGVWPHELVRDAIDEELRWRDPEGSRALQHAVNRHLIRQLQRGLNIQHSIFELQYIERRSSVMQRFFNFAALGSISVKPAAAADADGIARLRDAGLPPAERRLFDHWRHHKATRILTAHRRYGELCGVTQILRLDGLDEQSAAIDPVVSAVRDVLGQELMDGYTSLMSRFTVPEGERRGLNPAMNALQNSHYMLWATEPNLRFYVVAPIYPDHFAPLLEGTRFRRLAGCDRVIDGIPIGCFVHDWQAEPWIEWRDRLLDV